MGKQTVSCKELYTRRILCKKYERVFNRVFSIIARHFDGKSSYKSFLMKDKDLFIVRIQYHLTYVNVMAVDQLATQGA